MRPGSAHLRQHPFAQGLRRAIDARGISLIQLRAMLATRGFTVSVSSLSYWRSGVRHPEGTRSREIVAELERILSTPSGALTALIGPSRRTGRIGAPRFPWDDAALVDAMATVHADLGLEFPPPIRDLSMSAVTDVHPHGGIASRRNTMLVQAVVGGVTALPFIEVMPWVSIPTPTFSVLGGGEVSGVVSHPSGRVHGARVELSQPLASGATAILETQIDFDAHGPMVFETGLGSNRTIQNLLLWVRFPSEAVPDWCTLVEEQRGTTVTRPLVLDRAGSGHVSRQGFGPGAVGVHWGYEGRGSRADFRPGE